MNMSIVQEDAYQRKSSKLTSLAKKNILRINNCTEITAI